MNLMDRFPVLVKAGYYIRPSYRTLLFDATPVDQPSPGDVPARRKL